MTNRRRRPSDRGLLFAFQGCHGIISKARLQRGESDNDRQENPLIKDTITTKAKPAFTYIRDKYTEKLKMLSESDMMKSDDDFNKMYEKAKANYEDIITPYITFANQEDNFSFSLEGNKDGGDMENMSFEQFRSQIMNTYSSSKP